MPHRYTKQYYAEQKLYDPFWLEKLSKLASEQKINGSFPDRAGNGIDETAPIRTPEVAEKAEWQFQPDGDEVDRFVKALFKHATTGWISLRAFTHEKPSQKWGCEKTGEFATRWASVQVGDVRLARAATRMAGLCANTEAFREDAPSEFFRYVPQGVVFAPPVCTLRNPHGAKTSDIAEGVALSLECDGPDDKHPNECPPEEAAENLRLILGAPTVAIESGSIWIDPETGAEQPKWHMHYRLAVPTRGPEAHEKLRQARNLAARIVGSDRSASSLVHPLRWPGSWNRKGTPRMARIVEYNPDIEVDLDDTLALLRQIAEELGIEVKPENTASRDRSFEADDETEAKAVAAVAVVPNNLDYDEWIQIGMEIYDAFEGSGEGFDLWDNFSQQSPKYHRATTEKKWRSFRSGGRTVASLFRRADQVNPSWREQFKPKFPGAHLPGANMTFKEMLAEYETDPPSNEELRAAYEAEREWMIESGLIADPGALKKSEFPRRPQQAQAEAEPSAARASDAQPMDLFGNLTPDPVMTIDMLPKVIRDFVSEHSKMLGHADPGPMAIAAIVICASLVSDNVRINPKRHEDYFESARLWLMLPGEVSSRKTPMIKKLMGPVNRIIGRLEREDACAIEAYQRQLEVYEKKRKEWVHRTAAGDDEVSGFPPEKPEKPPRRRLTSNDFTIEGLRHVLRENPRGILLEMDEIMQLFGGFDAYKKSGAKKDRPITLQLWNGGPRSIDRESSKDDPVFVHNWGASMIGGIQPRILQQIGPELVDDGLLQRFLMVPMEPAGEEQDYPIEDRIERNYQNLIESLVGFDPKNENGVTIRLSDDAHQYRQQMQDLIQALQTLPGLNYGFRTHVGKMGAIFARLLLTLHMIDQAPVFSLKGDDFYTVTGDTARQAYDLMVKYLIPHGVRQYDRIFEADDNDVRWLAGYIVAKQAQTVTARVCHDASRVFKREPKRAKAAIQVLMDANWLDQDHNVNPRVHELFAERAEHERRTRADLERRITKARTLKKKAFGK